LGVAFSSENNDVLEGFTASSDWFAALGFAGFLRESITTFILEKKEI
jgi:hypothetical protein